MIVVDGLLAGRKRLMFACLVVLIAFAVSLDHAVDLVVAAPFAVTLQGFGSSRLPLWSLPRLAAVLGGAALTALWSLFLIHETGLGAQPEVAWILAGATATISLVLARWLARTPVPAVFESVDAAYETEPAVIAARLA
jgi:hypothetical protein